MKLNILKLSRNVYCRRCNSSGGKFARLNFFRYEHLGFKKVCDADEKQQVLPNKLSTLYVPGRYGSKMYQIVKPIIDVNFISGNINTIEQSCKSRGIELGVDGENLISLLKEWQILKSRFADIVAKDREFLNEQTRLKSLNLMEELERVKNEHSKAIDVLKTEKEKFHDIEEILFPIVQKIPNNIAKTSPIDCDEVEICMEVPKPDFKSFSHVNIGKNMLMLEFSQISPTAYYLTGGLAELELALQNFFCDKFRDMDHTPMSCTDFCKSFIIEAIGLDPYSPEDCISLMPKDNRDVGQKLNLVGGASFASFCAYLTNMKIAQSTLPAKYFSLGRFYDAGHRQIKSPDLFSVVQSSNIHCLVLCEAVNERLEFDTLFNEFISFYKFFHVPFRTVNMSARNLNSSESRRKQIELWSPSHQKFIPVSCLSQRGDFVSKRLHITFGEETDVSGYCSIVEGVAINFPVLIGCIMENFQNPDLTFNFPKALRLFNDFETK